MGPDYVTDIGYLRNFHPDLAPSQLRLVAALNGLAPPPAEDFAYCELGCAYGDTTVVLAAANPRASFVGIDINPEHIALAESTARAGGVDNVRFLCRDLADFADPARDEIGTFDFITAHGVMSWVGPDKRRALVELAAARLKPGGLLFISYNALPGWAAIEPLRQLLLSRAGTEGDSLERARKGLELAKQMRDAGAVYFTDNPAAAEMLATMEKVGLRYVVHEYLHAHWAPMYFAHVAWDLANAGLAFVGSLPLESNYRDLVIPPKLAGVFEGVTDRSTFESLKDFALNESFRRDVYVKGKPARSPAVTSAYLDDTSFVSLRRQSAPKGRLLESMLRVLDDGSATGRHLAKHPDLVAAGAEQVRAALLHLVIGEHVVPVNGVTMAVATSVADPHAVPSPFNRMVLARQLSSEVPIVLASPVSATGVPITALEAVAIRLVAEVPPEDRPDWIRSHFGPGELRMTVQDRVVHTVEEQTAVVLEALDQLDKTGLLHLTELGILEPTG